MTRRPPLVSTVIVALAVAGMMALGVWQLQRKGEKERALGQWRANLSRPAAAYPRGNPADERYLFRTLSAHCLRVVEWRSIGGRMPDGRAGWRHIATCATGAEGPGMVVDVGMGADPAQRLAWGGGPVRGIATQEPRSTTLIDRLHDWLTGYSVPARLMIVAEPALPGLVASPRPDPGSVPNNHLGYAIQWFLFAAMALLIYALALRRRAREG